MFPLSKRKPFETGRGPVTREKNTRAQAFSYKLYKQSPAGKFKGKWGWLTWLQKLIPQEKLGSPQPKIHLKDWDKCGFSSDRTP